MTARRQYLILKLAEKIADAAEIYRRQGDRGQEQKDLEHASMLFGCAITDRESRLILRG